MAIATASNLVQRFGAEGVFEGVTFEIQERDRIALVGVNGSGKTSLLRILVGLDRPEAGTVAIGNDVRVGYLPQEVTFPPEQTLREYILGAFEPLLRMEAELERLADALARSHNGHGAVDTLLEQHDRLLHQYEYGGGYTYQNRLREALAGLGLDERQLDQPVQSLSGGQRTRAALARLLLTGQDLLLLDEPTNHLDVTATEWLEGYLAQAQQALVVVSHDRYFLDKVATRTWELSFGRLEAYAGNYSRFAEQRAERHLRLQKEYEAQQRHIARTEAYIRRYRAGQRARNARGRQKQLDRLTRITRQSDPGALKLAIQSTLRSGDTVLATENLVVAAGTPPAELRQAAPGMPVLREAREQRPLPRDTMLFRCPNVELRRGDRVAIIGPNGSGKTTFLRIVTGELEPAAGRAYVGYGVQIAYYAQAHEQLNLRSTVLDEILSVKPQGEETARTYLGRFLFTGDDVRKSVSSLSGGERSRLALAKMALGNANFLVLDEPTNHLDIYSREALEDVLSSFGGSIMFVSHDRYLIDGLATQIWEIADARLTVHPGGWSDYVAARERAAQERATAEADARAAAAAGRPDQAAATEARTSAREAAALRAELAEVEAAIASGEDSLQQLAEQIEVASREAHVRQIGELGRQHEVQVADLARLEQRWLTLHEALEATVPTT